MAPFVVSQLSVVSSHQQLLIGADRWRLSVTSDIRIMAYIFVVYDDFGNTIPSEP